jgi:hypothetical protein
MYQMVIKIPTSSIAKQKLPKFGFLVWKYTIWQHWTGVGKTRENLLFRSWRKNNEVFRQSKSAVLSGTLKKEDNKRKKGEGEQLESATRWRGQPVWPGGQCYEIDNIFAEKFGENIGVWTQNTDSECQKWSIKLIFNKIQFCRPKLGKIA